MKRGAEKSEGKVRARGSASERNKARRAFVEQKEAKWIEFERQVKQRIFKPGRSKALDSASPALWSDVCAVKGAAYEIAGVIAQSDGVAQPVAEEKEGELDQDASFSRP